MKNFKVTVDGTVYNVTVEENGNYENTENHTPQTNNTKEEVKTAPNNTNVSGKEVVAPMPGSILDIKLNVGDPVKAGDTIIILEAMKMENEIVSPIDGKIGSINVKAGDSVNSNDILAIIS